MVQCDVRPVCWVPAVTLPFPADLYVCAVLLCCVGILSVLLFTLAIAWQSVLSKRKPRGKRRRSGMGALAQRTQGVRAEPPGLKKAS